MKYTREQIKERFNLKKSTVIARFRSKYAKERWGVEVITLSDGSLRRVVPEEKLYLWEGNPSYRGRPEVI
jgi:hypothetical protein